MSELLQLLQPEQINLWVPEQQQQLLQPELLSGNVFSSLIHSVARNAKSVWVHLFGYSWDLVALTCIVCPGQLCIPIEGVRKTPKPKVLFLFYWLIADNVTVLVGADRCGLPTAVGADCPVGADRCGLPTSIPVHHRHDGMFVVLFLLGGMFVVMGWFIS